MGVGKSTMASRVVGNKSTRLYPQNSTFGLREGKMVNILVYGKFEVFFTHFFIIIHRNAFPIVCDSSWIWYVAADKSGSAPFSWTLEGQYQTTANWQASNTERGRTTFIFGTLLDIFGCFNV